MHISKNDAYELFRKLSMQEDSDNKLYYENQEKVDSVFVQIEKAVDRRIDDLKSQLKNLQRFESRSYFVGNPDKFPRGCRSCLSGSGLSTIRKTNKCNLECRFCYYYGNMDNQPAIPDDVWEIGGTRFYEKDIDMLIQISRKPSGVAYAYLEPFINIEEYYPVIKKFHCAGIYQHLYTNGVLVTKESLKALRDAGLDELRFNLGASGCSDKVIENIKLAKEIIPYVGIETPMTPEFFSAFEKKESKILETGLDFINCAELHLNSANINNYRGEPLYMCRFGYISPVWSHELTLKFMKRAEERHWDICVHDCSNYTKFARDLNMSNRLNMWYGACSYSSEFDCIPYEHFLPVLSDPDIVFSEG